MKGKIIIMEGDLTAMNVDAIVNAANNELKLGAGVASAIRKKGGPAIQDECDQIGPVEVSSAVITGAGNLPALYVIHAASMSPGGKTTEENLRAATRNSLLCAREKGLKTIAFPAIGTGAAGFPLERCAEVMLEEVKAHLSAETSLEKIYFVLFGKDAYLTFKTAYEKIG
jgi:O-acetyl-ADP-ribose deacetylase (regulator of RNase III)